MLTPATLYKRIIRVINQLHYQWVFATLFGFATHLSAQSLPPGFASAQIQDGYSVPVGVIFSTDGRQLFVWDKAGRVWVSTWNGATYVRQAAPVIDISEEVGNWGDFGLLSACLDPNFSSNGLLYLFYVVDRHHLLYYGTPQYSKDTDEYANASISRVTRYRVTTAGGALLADQSSRRVLLGESKSTGIPLTYGSHAGGTLLFGRDGTLLVSTGDNASYDAVDVGSDGRTYYQAALTDGIMRADENVGALRAQLLGSLCGKVLRLDPGTGDGVSSNPFFDGANARSARSRVWAMGLRNPYRMTLQPGTGSPNPNEGSPGTLLLGDVGWYTTEDFHRIDQAGLNCGWPLYEGLDEAYGYCGKNIRNEEEPGRPTFESLCQQPTSPAVDPDRTKRRFTHSRPALDWRHDSPVARVPAFEGSTPVVRTIGTAGAPTGTPFSGNASMGGAYYTGTQFPATYQNSYFFADWGQNWIKNIVLHDHGDHIVHEVRDFAPTGFGQGIADLEVNPLDGSLFYVNVSGQIMRISYGGNQPPVARPTADVTTGSSLLRVRFSGANSTDPEGRPLRFHWDFGDGTTSEETNPEHLFTSSDERKFIVMLVVTDDQQVTDSKQLTISLNGVAPTAKITSPADGTLYPLDRASYYTLTAEVTGSDPPSLTYEWQVALLHNTHEHPEPVISEVSPRIRISPVGCSGNESYSYRISLKVTNRSGLSATTSVRLYPDCQSVSNVVSQVTTVPLPNAVRVNWQNPAIAFDEVMVATRAGTGFQGHPTGTDYAADADFTGNGTAFDGGKVVFRGRAEEVTVRNLTASTPYFFRLYTRIGDTWNAGVEVTATPTGGPAAANFAMTGVTLVRCESVSASQRLLSFTPQYAGLNGQPVSFWVANETMPTTSPGPYTLRIYADNPTITLKAQQGGTAASFAYNWLAACAGGTTPPPPPANQPPTTVITIPNQRGVVGQAFSLTIPTTTFSDPNGDALTVSMSGLPGGLNFSSNSATISGTPTTAGQATVTLTATDPGNLSISTQFQLTISPAATAPPDNPPPSSAGFAMTGVTLVRCESVSAGQRLLSFTPQYAGLNGQPVSFEVVREMVTTTAPGPYTLRIYTDNPTITLRAQQGGTAASFAYNWLAACAGGTTPPPANQPPTTAQPIANQAAMVGQPFSLAIPASTFSDPNGDALTYSVTGLPNGLSFGANPTTISGSPTTAGQTTVTLTATDPGNLSISTQFQLTISPAATTPPTNPPTPSAGFAITGVTTVRCESVSAGQRLLSFTPQYAGLNGQPVSFWVANETMPITSPGPYTLRIYADNPTITLKATQANSAAEASFVYQWLAACPAGNARLGVASGEDLRVLVLGNPVLTETAEVEILGGAGSWLRLQTLDGRGRRTSDTTIPQAASAERIFVKLTGPAGLYLLHVSTPTQHRVVKLVKL